MQAGRQKGSESGQTKGTHNDPKATKHSITYVLSWGLSFNLSFWHLPQTSTPSAALNSTLTLALSLSLFPPLLIVCSFLMCSVVSLVISYIIFSLIISGINCNAGNFHINCIDKFQMSTKCVCQSRFAFSFLMLHN